MGALLATPAIIWAHVRLSQAAEHNRLMGWLAMTTFLGAWLAVITFFTTLFMLGALLVAR